MRGVTSGMHGTGTFSNSPAALDVDARRRRGAVAVAVVFAMLAAIGVWHAAPAQAASYTFLINTLVANGDDTSPGDGVCKTSGGTCSLRAALQEANALPADAQITIAPAATTTGTITGDASKTDNRMFSGTLASGESYAFFMATRAMDIDFQNRLGISSTGTTGAAGVYINGPGVHVRNFTNIITNKSAFVIGANGKNAVIENGSVVDSAVSIQRCVALTSGADGVTVRGLTVATIASAGGGCVWIPSGATINDLTVENSRFYHTAGKSTSYSAFALTGNATLNRLRIVNNTLDGFKGATFVLDLRYAALTDSLISGNTFTDVATTSSSSSTTGGEIVMSRQGVNNVISKNKFTAKSPEPSTPASVIKLTGMGIATTDNSGFKIQDNVFRGFDGNPNIHITAGSGIVAAERNLFLDPSFGWAMDTSETNGMNPVQIEATSAYKKNATWWPSVVANGSTCTLELTVVAPTATTSTVKLPEGPVTLDFFYAITRSDLKTVGAEAYLGRQTNVTTTGTKVTIPYTQGAGMIRVQTMDKYGASSQYSRAVAAPVASDTCGPAVTIDQATSQADPTSVRDIAFDVEASEAVAQDLTADGIDLSASTAPGAQVTSIVRTSDTSFTVTTKANGSGTIVAKVKAGALKDATGNASSASTSADNAVTYVSPLTVAPASVTVTENGPSATYAVTSSIAATDTITVAATPNHPEWVATQPGTLTIPTTSARGEFTVSAVDDNLPNGTRQAAISHLVTSADPNFNGLVLPAVDVEVLDDDAPSATTSTLTTTPGGPVVADGTSAYTATATIRNPAGRPLAGVTAIFTGTSQAALSAPSCITAADGTCSITVASTTVGNAGLSAKIGDAHVTGSPATLAFGAGPVSPQHTVITIGSTTYDDDAMTATPITITLFDAFGHRVTTPGATVSVSASAGTLSGVRDNGDGTYTATLTAPTSDGTITLGYRVNSAPVEDPVTITLEPGVASPATSSVTASPDSLMADGVSRSQVTVTLKDAQGVQLDRGGDVVTVVTTNGTTQAVTDNGDGTYTTTLISSTTPGTATVGFTVNGVSGSHTADVTFTSCAPDPTQSRIKATPASITADGIATSAITVTLLDASGNPASGDHTVTVAASAGTVGAVTRSSDGVYTATLTSATTVGTSTVFFTVNGQAGSAKATVDFVVGAPSATGSLITASLPEIVADGRSTATVTVTLRDVNSNPITTGGANVTIHTDRGTLGEVTDHGDGTYSVVLTSATAAGEALVTFSVGGAVSSNTTTVRFTEPPTPKLSITKEAFRASDAAFESPIAAGERLASGTAIVWRYTITNTGTVTLSGVGVKDSETRTTAGTSATTDVAVTCAQTTLAPAQKAVCTGSGTL